MMLRPAFAAVFALAFSIRASAQPPALPTGAAAQYRAMDSFGLAIGMCRPVAADRSSDNLISPASKTDALSLNIGSHLLSDGLG
jgi:hypothetical protein